MTPEISIVIPSLGREKVLSDTVRQLSDQRLSHWECVAVLQGERVDHSVIQDMASVDTRLHVFHTAEPNASLARNIGLRESRADIVLFLDDDVFLPTPSFLDAHLRHYIDPAVPGVAGQVIGPEHSIRMTRHRRSLRPNTGWLYFPSNYAFETRGRWGGAGNLSVRRRWALEVGGMDARFVKGAHREESDFCMRYTRRYGPFVFDPAASLMHLQVDAGGCRSWGHNSGVHPEHHVAGEWYFIQKGLARGYISLVDLPDHLLQLVLRQVWNQENRSNPRDLLRAMWRSVKGIIVARRQLRAGPLESDTLSSGVYEKL